MLGIGVICLLVVGQGLALAEKLYFNGYRNGRSKPRPYKYTGVIQGKLTPC